MDENEIDRFFEQLCEQQYADLGNFLLALTRNRDQAQDLLQETFIIAWKKRAMLASHPNPAGFLFQTARLCLKSAQRKQAKEQSRVVYLEQEELVQQSGVEDMGDLLEELLRQQDAGIDEQQWIEAVLQTLSPDEHRLYEEHYLHQKTFLQLAKEWGISQTSLRMRAVRLRRKIRRTVQRLSLEEERPGQSAQYPFKV